MAQSIRSISSEIKTRRKDVLNRKTTSKSLFLSGIALIAILNFSIPLLNAEVSSCNSVFVNVIELVSRSIFPNFTGGQGTAPDQFVNN